VSLDEIVEGVITATRDDAPFAHALEYRLQPNGQRLLHPRERAPTDVPAPLHVEAGRG
jgi:hypothetical protein